MQTVHVPSSFMVRFLSDLMIVCCVCCLQSASSGIDRELDTIDPHHGSFAEGGLGRSVGGEDYQVTR